MTINRRVQLNRELYLNGSGTLTQYPGNMTMMISGYVKQVTSFDRKVVVVFFLCDFNFNLEQNNKTNHYYIYIYEQVLFLLMINSIQFNLIFE